MTYRATSASNLGLFIMGVSIAVLLIGAGLSSRQVQIGLLIAGGMIVGGMVAVRLRCVVRVSEEELEARYLVGQARMKWQDLVRVGPATSSGYWASRVFGPSVIEFASPTSVMKVNFKLFRAECLEDVLRHVPPSARLQG